MKTVVGIRRFARFLFALYRHAMLTKDIVQFIPTPTFNPDRSRVCFRALCSFTVPTRGFSTPSYDTIIFIHFCYVLCSRFLGRVKITANGCWYEMLEISEL